MSILDNTLSEAKAWKHGTNKLIKNILCWKFWCQTLKLQVWADKGILPHYISLYYVTRDLVRFVMHCDLKIIFPLLKIFQINISHICGRWFHLDLDIFLRQEETIHYHCRIGFFLLPLNLELHSNHIKMLPSLHIHHIVLHNGTFANAHFCFQCLQLA